MLRAAEETIQNGLAYEICIAAIGPAETECDITADSIKEILFVEITPMDAASAAAAIGYLKDTFVIGSNSCVIVGDNSTQYLVKLIGKL